MKDKTSHSAEPLARLVDEYLMYLHESQPTDAAFDGIHQHDDLLEDFDRASIDARVRELGVWARRVEGIHKSALMGEEKLERRMLADSIRARIYNLEEICEWKRSPLCYAETLAGSLSGQVLFAYAPITVRARCVISKLRQVPRFLESARRNITDPPGLFVKVGIESFKGLLTFIEQSLPKAFRELDDMHLLGDLADASGVAIDSLHDYIGYLRDTMAPRSRASFRLGSKLFSEKLRLEEGINVPVNRLLEIALRELEATQEEFVEVASRVDRDPAVAWQTIKTRHPDSKELLNVVEGQLKDLETFLRRNRIVSIPENKSIVVAPTPDFYRWTFASMWSPGAFEPTALTAYYYLTNVDPSWSRDRQDQHLRDLSYATLWSISMHEVFPGHFLHFEHLRKVNSPLRRSKCFGPVSFIEGWAHYCEQMMLDEGFESKNAEVKLGQLAESLLRLARTIVGIRLHTEDLSVEQGVRFFREEAFLEESNARREAERGTFDPSYVLYALGKRMLLKLRADYETTTQDKFSLKQFHDNLLGQGNLPFWMHREIMLDGSGSLLE